MGRRLLAIATVIGSAGALALGPMTASAREEPDPTLAVSGAVAAPATYTATELAAMPLTTAQVRAFPGRRGRPHTEQGVLLETLANLSRPILPAAKNAFLRVVLTVQGDDEKGVTFALGELDPNFGNHPALLSIKEDGVQLRSPKLVIPGDTKPIRFLDRVERITVGVESPVPTSPASGAVDLLGGRHAIVLSSALLNSLPAQTLAVSFIAGTSTQHHTEKGPTLLEVLAAEDIRVTPTTWVAAVGSDGYVAVVTLAEASVGGKQLLFSTAEDGVSLSQPRLIVDGDVKGGRYVSLVVDLVVGRTAHSED
jgi:hypothetical protein